jgi:hypothetical protein
MTFSTMRDRRPGAFTFIELMFAVLIFSLVSVGLFTFTSTSLRLISRNLATNHTHECMRISGQKLLYDLHKSASAFWLVNFDGTNYTDATPAASTDVDPFTQQYISTRANGVRFRVLGGGPYQLTASTKSTDTNLTFNFGVSGAVPYVPEVGDKVAFPLVAREYDISAVPTVPTTGSTTGIVTISNAGGIGYTINTTTASNVTTAYFYREVAYTIYNNQLRFHANYTGASKGSYRMIRDRLTSPKPFAVLFPSGASASDGLNLRMSLEFYDTNYSARKFSSGATTLQAVIPLRVQPPAVMSTNAS